MTSTAHFTTLPVELICKIFEFAADFSVVVNLARTARIFFHTWRDNPTSICQAVVCRVLTNLSDAEQLADMQEEAEGVNQTQVDHKQKTLIRTKRLLSNARAVSAASTDWNNLWSIDNATFGGEKGKPARPSEIMRFEHAFYRVWMIGVMGTAPHLQDRASRILDEYSSREVCRISELAVWSRDYNENELQSVGLDFTDEVWKTAYALVMNRWWAYTRKYGSGGPLNVSDTPVGFYAFYDDTQRYVDKYPDH